LDNPVANANELALFINFVRQEPTTAYSASGTTLTLTEATSSSDDMYCVYLGKAVQTVNPPNASVGASQIVDASITSGKLASGVLPTNTPAFCVYGSGSNQSISSGTNTKVQINNTLFDTHSGWDSSNYKWTVPSGQGGKYYVFAMLGAFSSSNNISNFGVKMRLNGSGSNLISQQQNNIAMRHLECTLSTFYTFSAGDYIELYGDISASSPEFRRDGQSMWFGANKIIGA